MRNPAILARSASALRRYHECPGAGTAFSVFETVRRYHTEARQRLVPFPPAMAPALAALGRIEQALGAPGHLCLCHHDLLAGNFIQDGQKEKVWIIDWEYARKGDLFFDLGNLAANNHFTEEQEREFLRHYFGVTRAGDLARLRWMRLASDLREAMWGFLQMGISTLDFDYESYAHRHLRRFLRNAKQHQGLFGGG
jgi:thiamine kinase-like enzyme